jgi:hypothetical protein
MFSTKARRCTDCTHITVSQSKTHSEKEWIVGPQQNLLRFYTGLSSCQPFLYCSSAKSDMFVDNCGVQRLKESPYSPKDCDSPSLFAARASYGSSCMFLRWAAQAVISHHQPRVILSTKTATYSGTYKPPYQRGRQSPSSNLYYE